MSCTWAVGGRSTRHTPVLVRMRRIMVEIDTAIISYELLRTECEVRGVVSYLDFDLDLAIVMVASRQNTVAKA